jgi:myo-inositol-1(or 4)-monophosphatase
MTHIDDAFSRALEAVIRPVGRYIAEERKNFQRTSVETKSLNALVSYVDQEAERRLVDGLHRLLPEAGFIAEEGSGTPSPDRSWDWVVDPLDGTTNFIHGIPTYAVSVGLLHGQDLVAAAVYELGQDEYFSAESGRGTRCNGLPVRVSSTSNVSDSLVATGFPYYDFSEMAAYAGVLNDCFQHTRGVRRLGSAATDLAYVACGRFDAFFEHGLSPWDVAAGILLVEEAGGRATSFGSQALSHRDLVHCREMVAGNPAVGSELHRWTQNRFQRP